MIASLKRPHPLPSPREAAPAMLMLGASMSSVRPLAEVRPRGGAAVLLEALRSGDDGQVAGRVVAMELPFGPLAG